MRGLARRLQGAALAAAAVALALLVLLHRRLTRPLLRRIADIRAGAAAIGRGELDIRLAVATRDELGLLVAGFNRMAARLARREARVAADRARPGGDGGARHRRAARRQLPASRRSTARAAASSPT